MSVILPYYSYRSIDPTTNVLVVTNGGVHYEFMAYDAEKSIMEAIEEYRRRRNEIQN